jgi:hypothetical protein
MNFLKQGRETRALLLPGLGAALARVWLLETERRPTSAS